MTVHEGRELQGVQNCVLANVRYAFFVWCCVCHLLAIVAVSKRLFNLAM